MSETAAPRVPGKSFPLLLSALTATTALSIDMSLPAMPELAKAFHAPVDAVQLTLSLFLVGYAVGQLVCGPISDRLGRRPVMMTALLVYCLAGFACAAGHSLTMLVAARLVQGLAASAGPVIARAMVRDCYSHREAAGILSMITQVIILVPLLAPLLGGYLLVWFGWPSIFLMLAGCGAFLLLVCRQILPETLARRTAPLEASTSGKNVALPDLSPWQGFAKVLSHRATLRHLLTSCFVYSGMFAYISSAPFLVIDIFHVARQNFAFVFALTALALLAGASLNRALLALYPPAMLLRLGASCVLAGGLLMAGLAWFQVGGLAGVVGPMMLFLFGQGLVLPNATAGAMAPHGQLAGAASSLMGAMQTGGGAFAGYCVSRLYNGTSFPLAATVAVLAILAFAVLDRSKPALPVNAVKIAEAESEGEMALHESGA